jgi:O-acetylhomoserine (thiol)-lyase
MSAENMTSKNITVTNTVKHAKILSPKRNTTQATTIDELTDEQLAHFGIDKDSEYGQALFNTAQHLYYTQANMQQLWQITSDTLEGLSKENSIPYKILFALPIKV